MSDIQTTDVRTKVDALEKDYHRLRWLSVALLALVSFIFLAGFYWSGALAKYEALQSEIGAARELRSALIAEKRDQKGALSSNSTESAHDAQHHKFPPATCPKGQYAAGVKAWGNVTGQCTTCFVGIQVICRSFVGE